MRGRKRTGVDLLVVALLLLGCEADPVERETESAPASPAPAVESKPKPASPPTPEAVAEPKQPKETAAATPEPTAAPKPAESVPPPAEDVPVPAASYPSDAPYFPGAHVDETELGPDGRIKRVSSSPDPGEAVYAHMMRSLEAHGWSIQSKLAQEGQFAVDATKGDRRAAVLIADRDLIDDGHGDTRITVLVTP